MLYSLVLAGGMAPRVARGHALAEGVEPGDPAERGFRHACEGVQDEGQRFCDDRRGHRLPNHGRRIQGKPIAVIIGTFITALLGYNALILRYQCITLHYQCLTLTLHCFVMSTVIILVCSSTALLIIYSLTIIIGSILIILENVRNSKILGRGC